MKTTMSRQMENTRPTKNQNMRMYVNDAGETPTMPQIVMLQRTSMVGN